MKITPIQKRTTTIFWKVGYSQSTNGCLREKTKFSQGLEYLQSLEENDTWKINSETALITSLTDVLALKNSLHRNL